MRQLWRLLQRDESLIGLRAIFVMIGVTLHFEDEVIRESVRCIPTVSDGHLLVGAVRPLLPPESVVLDVVDGFQVENGAERRQKVEAPHLRTPASENQRGEENGCGQTEHGVVLIDRLLLLLFHFVNTFP